jgi:hypothetical protein
VIKAYLAGPDVFMPNALEHAHRKIEICAKYGITGLAPLNQDAEPTSGQGADIKWTDIFHKDIEMMEVSDIIIANLTPFRGLPPMPAHSSKSAGSPGEVNRSSVTRMPRACLISAAWTRPASYPTQCVA